MPSLHFAMTAGVVESNAYPLLCATSLGLASFAAVPAVQSEKNSTHSPILNPEILLRDRRNETEIRQFQ
jgi:hypothetical protein